MEQEVLNLATKCVQVAISNALNYVTQMSSSNRTLKPTIVMRCRSSSNNRSNRKVSFHNTVPRCSLPATTTDLIHDQTRLLSFQQTYCRASRNINSNRSNRKFDIQYSFSLNKPRLTKFHKHRHNLNDIKNFADQLVQQSIRTAVFQVC